ncbi:MAG: TIGR03087 family PEP-CTERM/XrtA system glycosyltransferase [Thiohalocapsa sp.]
MTGAGANGGDLLLLCHRIPYPPDKGDKIRSHQWLRALAERYSVHLGAFVDDPNDWQYAPRLRAICANVCLVRLSPNRAKLRSVPALLTAAPLTPRYYRDARIAAWIAETMRSQQIERVVVYSSAMAQYVAGPRFSRLRRVIDFVDVDSEKWRQYAARRHGLVAWIYARESERLLEHDAAVAREFDLSLFVSRSEAGFFRSMVGSDVRSEHVTNGVDHLYFAPHAARVSPFPQGQSAIVFTGAMDYWANVDAVLWFARRVWPGIRAQAPGAAFYVVGSRPDAEIIALAADGIVVTGRVPDVRPYLQHAAAVVAPMRIARGIQNKVLEGMAMARPVVLTSAGLEGIDAADGNTVILADEPEYFAERVTELLSGRHPAIGAAARAFILRRFDWASATKRFMALVQG